ncbi:MAG: TonB-dependent receptor [Lentimicrobiaceae bacterium]|nr:TonB-dependent receptor [Lentimicrobiaceae bacterium]
MHRILLLLTLLCMLLLPQFLGAQSKNRTLSGYVTEEGSRELLIGVNVYFPEISKGTTTNRYGFYSITVPPGRYQVIFSYVGYQPEVRSIQLENDMSVNIALKSSIELEGVEVKATPYERISEAIQMSTIVLPVQQVRDIPALLGEKDVFKALQLMPGVQSGSEGSSGLYVRGGGPDQNLIILDDATVYNANHLFGFFSLFNGDALKSIELTKGGFPARYGGRLSSVVDMNMKDGNKEKLQGTAGIGLISSRLVLEGPIVKEKSSFLVSARRTYLDALTMPFQPEDSRGGYYFYDLNAKVNYDFGPKNKLYLSGYFGRDKFYFKETYVNSKSQAGLFWENGTGTLRWNHLFNNKLFSNTSLILSNYRLNIFTEEKYNNSEFELSYQSGIRDISVKHDLDYSLSPNHQIRGGFLVTFHKFTPSAIVLKDSDADIFDRKIKAINNIESGIYIEDEARFGSAFRVNTGIRVSGFTHENKTIIRPEPRISMAYKLRSDLSAKASFAIMNQYVHLLSNTGLGLPTDLWVPSTSNIGPQQSWQVAAGLARDLISRNLELSIEGYYKKSNDLLGYKDGASFLLIDDPTDAEEFNWEDNITQGQGWSYGAEVLLQRKTGKLTGWIGYTLSWTQRQFDDINQGEKFYAKYDRRHDVSVVGIYKITDDITISGTWVYGTGNAITLPLADYHAIIHNPVTTEQEYYNQWYYVTDYGGKNAFRMAAYHRLDFAVQFHKEKEHYKRTVELGVYNVYNRRNPFFYYIGSTGDFTSQEKKVLKQVSLFPLIPSISYTIDF